jgi:transcriptional regulator with XRE-family HTH domain
MEKQLGDRLQELLDDEGFSYEVLAGKTKLSKTTIGHWVANRNKPTGKNLKKLLEVFTNVNKTWLTEGVLPKYKKDTSPKDAKTDEEAHLVKENERLTKENQDLRNKLLEFYMKKGE